MGVILGGGGSDKQTVITNQLFESLIDPTKPILYIPLAWNHYDEGYQNCKKWLIGELKNIKHGEIEVIQTADEIANKNLSNYSAIFIGGGNTYKLLKLLKDSDAINHIKKYIDNGGLVYGGSAGSIIFGKDINVCSYMDTNNVNLKDTSGFDYLFGFSFTAHYTNKDQERTTEITKILKQYSMLKPVIALPEEDALYTDGNQVKVVGLRPWYIFNQGNIKQINPNVEYTKNAFLNVVHNVQGIPTKEIIER